MLKFCKNIRSVYSVALCRVVFNCELIKLSPISFHSEGGRFTKYLHSSPSGFRCAPLNIFVLGNDDSSFLDSLFMAKHKKTHNSKRKDASRLLEKRNKIHKHGKKKKKRSHSRSRKKDIGKRKNILDGHKSKRIKSSHRAASVPEIFLADGNSSGDEITIIFDSRIEKLNETSHHSVTVIGKKNGKGRRDSEVKIVQENIRVTVPPLGSLNDSSQDSVMVIDKNDNPASEITILHENVLSNESIVELSYESRVDVENIPLPEETADDVCVSAVNVGQLEHHTFELSSIPLPESQEATELVDVSAVAVPEDQSSVPELDAEVMQTPTNVEVSLNKATQTPTVNEDVMEPSHTLLTAELNLKNASQTSSVAESDLKKASQTPSNHHVVKERPKRRKSRVSSKTKEHKLLRRTWHYTTMGAALTSEESVNNTPKQLIFDVLSYNVLSQSIMEDHPELYRAHDSQALDWNYRSQLLLQELKSFNADIMCLQEVQHSHLESFYSKLHKLGYTGIYKQRTGNKVDGVAIYYKNDVFDMTDHTSIEYYQPGIEVLNRDNVGLVAKLAPKIKPSERIVVATTHLLFNPRRHDVKLAQIQLLLTEVERFAFKGFDTRTGVAQYWPVILTGDLNLEPHSAVYELLTTGSFRYEGLNQKTLSPGYGKQLSKEFLPRDLHITDSCQHWDILMQRRVKMLDHVTERSLLKIYNSDYDSCSDPKYEAAPVENSWVVALRSAEEAKDSDSSVCSTGMSSLNMNKHGFGTGELSHNLNLTSVYVHDQERWYDSSQVTTYQDRWVVVDYIFYSSLWQQYLQQKARDNLKLVARYKLLNEEEAEALGPIPNFRSPSDHYPLCAKFALLLW